MPANLLPLRFKNEPRRVAPALFPISIPAVIVQTEPVVSDKEDTVDVLWTIAVIPAFLIGSWEWCRPIDWADSCTSCWWLAIAWF